MGIIRSLMIAIVLFSGITLAVSKTYQAASSSYGQYNITSNSTLATLDKTPLISNIMNDTDRRVRNMASGQSSLLTSMYDSIFIFINTGVMILQMPEILIRIVTDIGSGLLGTNITFGDNSQWFLTMITVIIDIVIILAVLSWITKREL